MMNDEKEATLETSWWPFVYFLNFIRIADIRFLQFEEMNHSVK